MFSQQTNDLFKKACEGLGHNHVTILPDFSMFPEKHRMSVVAYPMLVLIIEWATKSWEPTLNENKHWTWHWLKAIKSKRSGFGFSYSSSNFDDSISSVGLRLCFPNNEMEKEFQEPLDELYEAYKLYNY